MNRPGPEVFKLLTGPTCCFRRLALLLQAVLIAYISTYSRVVGVRTSLPQLGAAGALVMLTAFAVAHLAPTTLLAGTTTGSTPEPTTGSLIRRGYLTAAVGGAIAPRIPADTAPAGGRQPAGRVRRRRLPRPPTRWAGDERLSRP